MKRQLVTLLRTYDECATVKTSEFQLSTPIQPKPGQCCTYFLLKEDGSYGEGRVYSISSSPLLTDKVSITYRMTPNFPTKLQSIKPGDKMGFFGPYGNFVFDERAESVVFLAGGVGIAPLLSMIKYVDEKKLPTKMVLIHSNRTVQETPFLGYFKDLEKRNPDFKYVLDLTRPEESAPWDGTKEEGYLTAEMLTRHVPYPETQSYYICGPPRYTHGAFEVLKSLGVTQEKIKFEQW
ncbi:MAG: FAD-dependent oxidoreductase [Candidatus Norongarragalinales archaeon]